MAGTTITFRVDEAERVDLAIRAEREKVSISDYIRVRLGLRGQGSQADEDDVEITSDDQTLREQLAEHDRRLAALEAKVT
jgi:hypothetical protein